MLLSLLVLIGAFTGLLSGLFGLGGGFLLVPLLVLTGHAMPVAVGTSLLYVASVGVSGAWSHWRAGNVDWRFVALTGIPAAVVAPLGALAATHLPERATTIAFGVFLTLMAGQMGRKPADTGGPDAVPAAAPAVALGGGVGFLSGIFGVGGGLLLVPAQVAWLRIGVKRAVGNSLAAVLLTGVVGTLAHGALGNVDVRAALALVAGGFVGVAAGTRLLKRISAERLRSALTIFLYFIAGAMVMRGLL